MAQTTNALTAPARDGGAVAAPTTTVRVLYVDNLSMVYTVGPQADSGGLVRRMTENLAQLGREVSAADGVLRDALGPEIVDTFLAVKRFEVERHRAWVSDWEVDEYLHHL
jgi:hypothetical protein